MDEDGGEEARVGRWSREGRWKGVEETGEAEREVGRRWGAEAGGCGDRVGGGGGEFVGGGGGCGAVDAGSSGERERALSS